MENKIEQYFKYARALNYFLFVSNDNLKIPKLSSRSSLVKVETDTQVYSPGSGYGTPSTGRGTPNRHLNWAIEVKDHL